VTAEPLTGLRDYIITLRESGLDTGDVVFFAL
jgi:hypothetical protein